MQILGIGPLEFLLIIVLAIIVLGPKGILTAARESGKMIHKLIRSPLWREVVDTSHEMRDLPRKIIQDAGIEQELIDLRRSAQGKPVELESKESRAKSLTGSQHPVISEKKQGNDKPMSGTSR